MRKGLIGRAAADGVCHGLLRVTSIYIWPHVWEE